MLVAPIFTSARGTDPELDPSPNAPTNVYAINTGSGEATVYWDFDAGSYGGSTTFEIERGDGFTFTPVGVAGVGAVSFVDTGILFGAYYWQVRAIGLIPSDWAVTDDPLLVS